MDAGSVDIDLNLNPGGFRRGIDEVKREIAGLDKQIRQIEAVRGRVSAAVFDRSFYRQDLQALQARRHALLQMADAEKVATQASKERARTLGALGGGSFGRAARFGVAGIVGNIAGRNLEDLGEEGGAASRIGGFLSNLTTGNIVGAIGSAREQVKLTADEIEKLGTDTNLSTTKLWKMTAALDALGQSDAAAKIREIRQEMISLQALEFAQRGFNVTVVGGVNVAVPRGVHPNDRGGMMGPGGVAAEAALGGTSTALPDTRGFGISTRLRTAIAAAYTTPGKADEIAQLRRARTVLQKQLASGALKTDEARLAVYTELEQVQDELTALTKKVTEKEKKRKKKKAEELQFIAVDPAAVLGGLGQGPFMQGDVMQFAQGFGYKPKARDYLRDIRQQVQTGSRLDRDLGLLRKRGLGDAALDELAVQGLGAADLVSALAKAPPALVRQYARQAERREQVAQRIQTFTAEIVTANIVIKNGRVIGIDRNGDNVLSAKERAAGAAGGR